MKKLFLMALLLPFVLFSCQTNEPERGNGTGQISVDGKKGVELNDPTHVTRADADVNQFTLIVADQDDPGNVVSGLFSTFAGGVIDNLRVGNYTVTLTSHPDGFTPAFADPMYQAVKENVTVTAGGNTMIELEAVQANSGVYFVYDNSLYEEFGEVVPTITQGANALVYEGANAEAWGYFHPEAAVLTIKDGNEFLTISGADQQTLALQSEQLLEITLRAERTGPDGGSITIVATVKVITEATHFEEYILGKGKGPEGFIDIVVSDLASRSAKTTLSAKEGFTIDALYYICATDAAIEEFYEDGGTLEELMFNYGSELPYLYLMLYINNGGTVGINWTLTSALRDYTFIAYAQSNGVWEPSSASFTIPESNSPIEEGAYGWTWYNEFNADFTSYSDPFMEFIDLVEVTNNPNYNFIFEDFWGISNLDMEAVYDEEAGTLTLTGYDTDGYQYVNVPDGLQYGTPGNPLYSCGWYVRDADMNLVDNIVFTVEDGKIKTSVYSVSMDFFTYGTDNFLYHDSMTPVGGELTFYGFDSASYNPSVARYLDKNLSAVKTRGGDVQNVIKAKSAM